MSSLRFVTLMLFSSLGLRIDSPPPLAPPRSDGGTYPPLEPAGPRPPPGPSSPGGASGASMMPRAIISCLSILFLYSRSLSEPTPRDLSPVCSLFSSEAIFLSAAVLSGMFTRSSMVSSLLCIVMFAALSCPKASPNLGQLRRSFDTLYVFFCTVDTRTRRVTRITCPALSPAPPAVRLYSVMVLTPFSSGPLTLGGRQIEL